MPKNTDKIREQIAALKADLKDAERAAQRKNEQAVVRAAQRAGLAQKGLSASRLEREFRAIAQSKPHERVSQNAPESTLGAASHERS